MNSSNVILVAVDLDARSAEALTIARDLAHAMAFELRLVHAVPDPLNPESLDLQSFLDGVRESLQDWAVQAAGVQVEPTSICVGFGAPLEIILREAMRPEVEMVVMGGDVSEVTSARNAMLHSMIRRCPRPLLHVGKRGAQPVVLAATDCSDPTLPVFHHAWVVAVALGDRLALVHNVDPMASQFAQRIGIPMSARLGSFLAQRSREWLEEVAAAGEVVITRDPDNAQGVMGAARVLGADLVVVGVRPAERASRKTADKLLDGVRSSVLFIPLRPAPQVCVTA